MKEKNAKVKIFISIALLLFIVASILGVQKAIELNSMSAEMKELKAYGELGEKDYKTESDNVEFSVFFPRDIDGDGNAERLKGTCMQIDSQDELYAELKVSNGGYFKNGRISFNTNDFKYETAIYKDNIVKNDYIGEVSNIELKDEVNNGSQKLFIGKIKTKNNLKINNINDYAKKGNMTLTGTYVDDNGNETPINVIREFDVDLYGKVITEIEKTNLTIEKTDKYMNVKFNVNNIDKAKQLVLKENKVIVEIPEINGYKAIDAKVLTNGTNVDFNEENQTLTITRESKIDENGNVLEELSNSNSYDVVLLYPVEAHGDDATDNKLYFSVEVPVTATYTGYNNKNFGEASSTDTTKIANVEDKGHIVYDRDAFNVYIGKIVDNNYVISKEKAIEEYNNVENTEEDTYNVKWIFTHQDKGTNGNAIMKETNPDKAIGNGINNIDISKYVSYSGIYFDSRIDKGQVKVYNDETNELIYTFTETSIKKYTESNPFKYEKNIKKIRIETEGLNEGSYLEANHIKEIDDKELAKNITKDDFDKIEGIYSYLYVYGSEYSESAEYAGYARYQAKTSDVIMEVSKKSISTLDNTTNENIYITTKMPEYNGRKWKNGQFLVKFPESVVSAQLNDIKINKENIKITGYDLYKENGNYYAKIITENDTEDLYTIQLNCDIVLDPMAVDRNTIGVEDDKGVLSVTDSFALWAYNENCNTYVNNWNDSYDVNSNNNVKENVAGYAQYIKIIAPSSLITGQTISNYDESGSVTVAPNIADVKKEERTADININILNNYDKIVSDVKILGTVPYQGNTGYFAGGSDKEEEKQDLGSTFSTTMTSDGIKDKDVTVYYTENGDATKDLNNVENGWTKTPSDWSKVKRYLIDLDNRVLSGERKYTFSYTVQLPTGLDYNKVSYTTHKLYYSIDTGDGKLETSIQPNKTGIRIARKYDLRITKLNKENGKVVPGATYKLTELGENEEKISQKLVTSDNEGVLKAKGIYVGSKYILEEIKTPDAYMLNPDKIKFIVKENEQKELNIEVLSEEGFKETPVIDNDILIATVEDEPRYQITITKKDNATNEKMPGVMFNVQPQNKSYTTDENGQVIIKNLDQNIEYTLKETYADGYYLLQDIKFKVIKDNNGELKVISENEAFKNAKVEVKENEDLLKLELELKDEKMPSIQINKIDKETKEYIKDVQFKVEGREGKVYTTDGNGQTTVNGFEENKEYTLKEIKAEGYYLQDIKFTIVKNENGKLKINSNNEEFANATVIDETRKILSVKLTNEKIPTYNLQVVKVMEGTNSKVLQGAQFHFASIDLDTVKDYTTDENGIINITNLYQYVEGKNVTGKYLLQEIVAPKGYSNNAEEIQFKVSKNEEGKLEAQIENKDNLVTLKDVIIEENTVKFVIQDKPLFTLVKTDSETGEKLANAKFVIYEVDDNNNAIDFAKDINGNYLGTQDEEGKYILTTDENGKIVLAIKNGKYMAMEVGFPEGYVERETIQYFEVKLGESNSTDEENSTDKNNEIISSVNSIEDLVKLSNSVNAGNNYGNKIVTLEKTLNFADDKSYLNPNDLSYGDLNEDGTVEGIKTELTKKETKGFTPIGIDYNKRFNGIFDGKGNEIRNIYINSKSSYTGLFGYCYNGGKVKNVGITGEIYGSYNNVGGILGAGTVENCYNLAQIHGPAKQENYDSCRIGGVVGSGTAIRCYNAGKVIGPDEISSRKVTYVGGIIGQGSATSCYNVGEVVAEATYNINTRSIGYKSDYGNITNCYYLDSLATSGDENNDSTKAVTEEYMKSDDFPIALNKYYFVKDVENKNNGYPIISESKKITDIEYIEDLVELSEQVQNGYNYENYNIILSKTLDFNDDSSYRNVADTIYGDINGDGTVEGIKEELTKEGSKGFLPIGNNTVQFKGTFDGQGNEINNLYINRPEEDYVGLFGYNSNTIKRVGISGNIIGKDNVGAISGNGNVEFSYNKANVKGEGSNVGGITGNGTAKACYNMGNVEGKNEVGGITPYASYTCYNIGNVTSQENVYPTAKNTTNSYYLNSIQITGTKQEKDNSLEVTEEHIKTEEFVKQLSKRLFKLDEENKNNGYPVINSQDDNVQTVEEIECIEDLVELSKHVNGGDDYSNVIVKLTKTLDFNEDNSYKDAQTTKYGDLNEDGTVEDIKTELTKEEGKGFTPIGNSLNAFKGEFDGQGYEIRNIYINRATESYIGLFGYVKDTKFSNIGITGKIVGDNETAGLIGQCENVNIENCYNKCNVKGDTYIGGIVGYQKGNVNIINCYNEGTIEGNYHIGGLVGQSAYDSGNIKANCYNIISSYNKGKIICHQTYIGGIIGWSYNANTTISKCYNEGEIVGDSEYPVYNIGGIIGYAGNINISDCYNKGKIIGNINKIDRAYSVGGIVGDAEQETNISKCYNEGCIEASRDAGGIIGYSSSSSLKRISDCYNKGTMKANAVDDYLNIYITIGGIIGNSYNVDISNCYNIGNIDVEAKKDTYIGGIVGRVYSTTAITESYNIGDISFKGNTGTYGYSAYIGGLTGNGGTINRCYNKGIINANLSSSGTYLYCGGICGNSGTVTDCYNIGDISNASIDLGGIYIGGISRYGGAINCYNTGNITNSVNNINRSSVYPYIYGISEEAINCYNTGNIVNIIENSYSDAMISPYIAGISNRATNCYNTGNISNTIKNSKYNYNYIGGIAIYEAENSYNSGNIQNKNINNESNFSNYIGGISANGNVTKSYNLGNIHQESISENEEESTGNNYIGRISGREDENSVIDCNYISTIKFEVDKPTNVNNHGTQVESIDMPDIKSQEFFNVINQNGVWLHINDMLPKLMLDKKQLGDSVELDIQNQIIKYDITTDISEVDGIKGGSISGEDETPYEQVRYGKENVKEIKMIPESGYAISNITVNGEKIDYKVAEDGTYTIPAKYFTNVRHDIKVVVEFAQKESALTVRKVDEDTNEPLKGAKFQIQDMGNEVLGKVTKAEGVEYGFEEKDGKIVNANSYFDEEGNYYTGNAASYIELDLSKKQGKYLVMADTTYNGSGAPFIGKITETKDVINNYNAYNNNVFIWEAESREDTKKRASQIIEGGKKYYLHIETGSGNPGIERTISNIKVCKVQENSNDIECIGANKPDYIGEVIPTGDCYFEEKDGKLIPNSYHETDKDEGGYYKAATSTIDIDLSNKTGIYTLSLNANNKVGRGTLFVELVDLQSGSYLNQGPTTNFIYRYNTNEEQTYWTNNLMITSQTDRDNTPRYLEGGKKYRLHLLYYADKDINEEELFINSIKLHKLNNATYYRVGKDSNTQTMELQTNEQGEIMIPSVGGEKYKITEIQAPEGYTLNSEPIEYNVDTEKENTLIVKNKAKQPVTVHHYLKDNEGNYTTVKVADDEISTFDIGEQYTSTPKLDIENIELEKNNDGQYITPENATGTVTDGGVEVIYYYETKPIEVTIHHYLDGTYTKLADDETIKYQSKANIEDNKVVSVSIDEKYDVQDNENYKKLLKDYLLTLIIHDGEVVNKEKSNDIEKFKIITITKNSEIDYYYKENLETSYKVEYYYDGKIDDSKTENLKGEIGNIITTNTPNIANSINANLITGYRLENTTLPITLNKDVAKNIIKVYYVKDDKNTKTLKYTVEYYKDGAKEDADTQIESKTVQVLDKDTLNVDKSKINITDKYVGYKFDKTDPEVIPDTVENGTVIKVYYVKDDCNYTIKYYYDGEVDNSKTETEIGVRGTEITKSDLEVKIRANNKTGYKLKDTENLPLTIDEDSSKNVIKVYYVKDSFNYTVEYYYNNVKDDSKTETGKALYGSKVTTYTDKNIEGYKLDREEGLPLTITANVSKNVIKVYYIKEDEKTKSLSYTVEYYKDNIKQDEDTQVERKTVLVSEADTMKVDKTKINLEDKYEGYEFLKTEPESIPDIVNNGDVIKVYYEKAKYDYTVEYYYDNVKDATKTETAEAEYGAKIEEYKDKCSKGYKFVKVENTPLTISDNTESNVIKVYYVSVYKVSVKHIDQYTGKTLDTEVLNKTKGERYETKAKEFDKYDLVETPENAQGIVTDNIDVKYYYKKNIKIQVRYVDKETGKDIFKKKVIKGHQGDTYKIEEKEIKYFKLVNKPETTEGKMEEDSTAIYYYEPLKFNLKVVNTITKLTKDGVENSVENGKLAKTEIHRTKLDKSDVKVELKLEVINNGELDGEATLVNKIPKGFEMKAEDNEGWTIDGQTALIRIGEIKVGETKEFKVVLNWIRGESNIGIKDDVAYITDISNEANRAEESLEDNEDSVTILLSVSTGEQETKEFIVGTIMLTIVILAVVATQKRKTI